MKRRSVVQHMALAAACVPWVGKALAHGNAGVIDPPVPLPDWQVSTHWGQPTKLSGLLKGRTVAMQLMFTGCSALCPLQGALFAAIQEALPRQLGERASRVSLLSMSIDPLADTPAALSKWLGQFGAGPTWLAARPSTTDLDALLSIFNGQSPRPAADRHSTQILVLDTSLNLRWRSVELPSAASVLQALNALST